MQPAFTIVELIVVVTVIVLILAIAVPGLSAMNAQARLISAQQLINGVTTRAYFLALANRAMTAVRFFPGEWDTIDPSAKQVPVGRQHMAIFNYVGTTLRENPPGSGNFSIQLGEYLERVKNVNSVLLPDDVWVAPVEALQATGNIALSTGAATSYNGGAGANLGRDFVLAGQGGQFAFNADPTYCGNFTNADDFLIVCDPDTGVRTGTPQPYHLRAYVPKMGNAWGYEADFSGNDSNDRTAWYQRYNFSGLITYRREPFVAVGSDTSKRQEYLRDEGRAFMVHRFSGGLVAGAGRP